MVPRVRRALESLQLEKIPGYRLAKAFANDGPTMSAERLMLLALVMDEFADGRLLMFLPDSPAPMSDAINICTPDRVTLLDVPLLLFMKATSSWGLGLRAMVEAAEVPPDQEESTATSGRAAVSSSRTDGTACWWQRRRWSG